MLPPHSSAPPAESPYDPDLREYRRGQALAALAERHTAKGLAPLTTKVMRKRKARPLFEPEEDELPQLGDVPSDADDPELELAIQQSMELEEETSLLRALEESRLAASNSASSSKHGESSSSKVPATPRPPASIDRRRSQHFQTLSDDSNDEGLYASPTRLELALSIGGAAPRRPPPSKSKGPTTPFPTSSMFGTPTLLMPEQSQPPPLDEVPVAISESEDDLEEVLVQSVPPPQSFEVSPAPGPSRSPSARPGSPSITNVAAAEPIAIDSDSDEDMEEVPAIAPPRPSPSRAITTDHTLASNTTDASVHDQTSPDPAMGAMAQTLVNVDRPANHSPPAVSHSVHRVPSPEQPPAIDSLTGPSAAQPIANQEAESSDSEAEGDGTKWSRSPSPSGDPTKDAARRAQGAAEDWDAAQELDPHAEEGEFARFISQVKGKDIESVRREIDDEIRDLNRQKKTAMRDSEDITQQMISQIMVSRCVPVVLTVL